jgi:hypothetical protein
MTRGKKRSTASSQFRFFISNLELGFVGFLTGSYLVNYSNPTPEMGTSHSPNHIGGTGETLRLALQNQSEDRLTPRPYAPRDCAL